MVTRHTTASLPDSHYYIRAHALPFDLADESSRGAFDMFLHRTIINYALFPRTCGPDDEYYRAESAPGLGDGEFASVELRISGNVARSIRRELGRQPRAGTVDWHTVANEIVDIRVAQLVRDDAAKLLFSGAAPAGPVPPPDSSEWLADMCWHGRYHFFHRFSPGGISPDQEFLAFAQRLLALGATVQPRHAPALTDSKNDCPAH